MYLLLRTEVTVASLVVQGLRFCFPRQGTGVPSLVRELRSHMLRAIAGRKSHVLQLRPNTAKN